MCAHADKNHRKINREYTAKKSYLRNNQYLGQFSVHSKKTSGADTIKKKRLLRGLLPVPTHIKISDEYVIKKILIAGVIAEFGRFSPQPLFYSDIFTVYLQFLCETSHTYKK